MARTQKDGLEYFPTNVDFYSGVDIKVIRSKFGSNGIVVYHFLLCEIYRNGYYFHVDNDFISVFAFEMGIKENAIRLIIKLLLDRKMFDYNLWQSDKVLTSAKIQQQYQKSKKNCKRTITVERKFWLLEKDETENFIKVYPVDNNSENNADNSEKNQDNSENYSTKKSKVNKSKVNEIKTNNPAHSQDYSKIIFLYNYICTDYAECQLTDNRISAIDTLLSSTIHGQAITVSIIAEAFEYAQNNEFLKGNKSDFSATLDWMLNYDNFVKISEQKYGRMEKKKQSYDISDFEKYAVNYSAFMEDESDTRHKMPEFCQNCSSRNPYECIINCHHKGWCDMNV